MLRFTVLVFVVCCGCSNLRFRQTSEIMAPTIKSNEVVTGHISHFRRVVPQRWDVVVFIPHPSTNGRNQVGLWCMRVVGLPSERINIREDGIYIDGKRQDQPGQISDIRYAPTVEGLTAVSYPYQVPLNSYFLLGDNTTNSFDSRFWGCLDGSRIIGRIKGK